MDAVFWFIPGKLAGRAGPHFVPWREAELRAAGIDTVLNLSEVPPDERALRAAGITAHWVPLPTDVPAVEETEKLCGTELPRALAVLERELAAGRRVLVHCTAGQDRTGMLFTLFTLRTEGVPLHAALERVRAVRPKAITAPGWEAMALRVIPAVAAKLR